VSASPDVDLEPERAARALLARGALREGMVLLRAVVARDPGEEGCARLLERLVLERGTQTPDAIDGDADVALTLEVVDRWIRSGMLVEALALLGGTPMGSEDTGREWANLLGELLAPVPVDAEPALVEMHRQLVTGGASVALVLLEERATGEPRMPAWAERRLELLRWMLLDNAHVAESAQPVDGAAPTALAEAVQRALVERSLTVLSDVARRFAAAQPDDTDARALVAAVDEMIAEVERHADDASPRPRTLPMFGHPSACMQLRMGNLEQACAVYRKLLQRQPDDTRAQHMLEVVQSVLRAARGEPVRAYDPWDDDGDTELAILPPLERVSFAPPTLEMPLDVLGHEDEPTERSDDGEGRDSSVLVRVIRTVE
jgi:hypothetical protein